MHSVLRAAPLALGSMLTFCTLRAQPAELPPIFAPRLIQETPPAVRREASALLSDRSRSLVNAATHNALANVTSFEAPAMTGSASAPELSVEVLGPAAVVMEPYVVSSAPIRLIERPLPDPLLLDFLKTGTFYRNPNATGFALTHIGLKMMILKQPGLGWGEEFTRGRIEFTFRF